MPESKSSSNRPESATSEREAGMGKDFVGGDFFEANFGRKAFIVIVDDVVLNVDIDGCDASSSANTSRPTHHKLFLFYLACNRDR